MTRILYRKYGEADARRPDKTESLVGCMVRMGLKPASISVRATQLRKKLAEKTGVELPKMKRRSRQPKNYDETADIVRQLLEQAS